MNYKFEYIIGELKVIKLIILIMSSFCIACVGCSSSEKNDASATANETPYSAVTNQREPDAEAVVGSEGGMVEVSDQNSPIYKVKIVIPEGALSGPSTISIAENNWDVDSTGNHLFLGHCINFDSDNNFNEPVLISFPYNDEDNNGIVDGTSFSEEDLSIYTYNIGLSSWERIEIDNIDIENNLIEFKTNHFSMYQTGISKKNLLIRLFSDVTSSNKVLSGQFVGYSGQIEGGREEFIDQANGLGDNKLEKRVSIMGVDYGFCWDINQFVNDNQEIIKYWKDGGLVTISWHAKSPWDPSRNDSVFDPNEPNNHLSPKKEMPTDASLNDLLDGWNGRSWLPVRQEAKNWKEELDYIADALKELSQNGVIVLWRPFHEMNGYWFWWGGQNKDEFIELWRHMYEYFVNTKKLDNLVWVYSPNSDFLIKPAGNYYPGDDYVDIVGLDKYDGIVLNGYSDLLNYGKPIGLTEFGPCDSGFEQYSCGYDYSNLLSFFNEGAYSELAFFQIWNEPWSLTRNSNPNLLLNNSMVVNLENLDLDGDKIHNIYDKCPNTPPNESVDNSGCSESQRAIEQQLFSFIHPEPGEISFTPTPKFIWTPHPEADKYFIRIGFLEGNTVWDEGNILTTETTIKWHGSGRGLAPGEYRAALYARYNDQTGVPDYDLGPFIDEINSIPFFVSYKIGSTYSVYGGDRPYNGGPFEDGRSYLGSSSETSAFYGSYNYYFIITPPGNVAYIDCIEGQNGNYCDSYVGEISSSSCQIVITYDQIKDLENLFGPPDERYAILGVKSNHSVHPSGEYIIGGGIIQVQANSPSMSQITVHTK